MLSFVEGGDPLVHKQIRVEWNSAFGSWRPIDGSLHPVVETIHNDTVACLTLDGIVPRLTGMQVAVYCL